MQFSLAIEKHLNQNEDLISILEDFSKFDRTIIEAK